MSFRRKTKSKGFCIVAGAIDNGNIAGDEESAKEAGSFYVQMFRTGYI